MPYNLPDDLIVFTIGNTTIGNELAMNDSLVLYSPDSSLISTFSYPKNTKDGFSLERVNPESGDSIENWIECLDTSGSTPGFENSSLTYCDPRIFNLFVLKDDSQIKISVFLSNPYYADCGRWEIQFKIDGREIGEIEGFGLAPRSETSLTFFFSPIPSGRREITARLYCAKDRDTTNNLLVTYFTDLREGEVILLPEVFSPDNDGKDDYLTISCFFEDGSDLTIDVYSLSGRKVKRIYKGRSERNMQLLWDGRDEHGSSLQRGIYILSFEYKKNGKGKFIKRSCVLAGRSR